MSHATPPGDLPSLILALGNSDRSSRERAAAEVFQRGGSLVCPVVEKWLRDEELAALLRCSNAAVPQMTVGLAVTPENFERIRKSCGSPRLAEVPPDQDAREFELHFDPDIRLDILTTRDPDAGGAIARFLRKFGEGIQQVELTTGNVDRATEILRGRLGLNPVYPVTRSGADGTRVNFFLVPAPEGKKILVELVEPGG